MFSRYLLPLIYLFKKKVNQIFLFVKESDPRGFVLVGIFLCAFLVLFNVIPHGQSPDEQMHMWRASSLAHGDVVVQSDKNHVGTEIDEGLVQYYTALSLMPFHYEKKASNLSSIRTIRFTGKRVLSGVQNTAPYFPAVYAPQALAIFVGEQLHLRVYVTVCLARLLCFLTVAGLVLVASRLWKLSALAGFLLLMPISFFQMVSSTSDGMNFAMTIFSLCLFMNLREDFTWVKFITLLIVLFALATHRFNLIFLFALPISIGVNNKNRRQFIVALLVALSAVGWILFASMSLPALRSQVSTTEMIIYYCLHPIDLILIFWRTATDIGLLRFYRDSFVGILGWLDYPVNQSLIYLTHIIIWGLIVSFVLKARSKLLNKTSMLLFAVAFFSTLASFVLLLVGWTDFPCIGSIQGVQGRYLILSFLIIGFALECCDSERKPSALEVKCSIALFLSYGFLSLFFTQLATMSRYWLS